MNNILKRSRDCLQRRKQALFYSNNKIWLLLAHSWFNSYARDSYPYFITAI